MRKNVLIVALVLLVALVGCAEHECSWKEVSSTAPTCTAYGERVFKCEGCGATRTEEIAKLPHELTDDGWKLNDVDFRYEQKCASCGEVQYKEIESGVRIQGIAGFENRLFETANEAYATINEFLKNNGGLGQEGLSDEKFNEVFTMIDENGNAKVVWTIYGEQDILQDEATPYFISFGRASMHYGDNNHLDTIELKGGNPSAKLNCKNLSFPCEWWGEDHSFSLSFNGLTLEGDESKSGNVMVYQSFTEGITISYDSCNINGRLGCFVNAKWTLNVLGCTFETIAKEVSAIQVQGGEGTEKAATVNIQDCTFINSRCIDIGQATAEAKIVGNTFVNCGNLTDDEDNNYYGVIQVTQGANVLVEGNTIENCKGNAIWVYSNSEGKGSFTGKLTIKDNVIKNCSYAFADYGNTYDLESSGNVVSETNVDKCFARVKEGESVVYKEIDATKLQ